MKHKQNYDLNEQQKKWFEFPSEVQRPMTFKKMVKAFRQRWWLSLSEEEQRAHLRKWKLQYRTRK